MTQHRLRELLHTGGIRGLLLVHQFSWVLEQHRVDVVRIQAVSRLPDAALGNVHSGYAWIARMASMERASAGSRGMFVELSFHQSKRLM